MKDIIFSSVFFSLVINLPAQQSEPLSLQVVYQFTHVYDTANRENPLTEKQQLLIGHSSSHYMKGSYVPMTMPAMEKQQQASGPTQVVTAVPIALVMDPFITVMNIFQLPATQKLLVIERIGIRDFLRETKLPVINWTLDTARRSILGYNCQKAVGQFAGRTYTAWFTTDIPLPYGPWKLNGLPGLLLEATDDRQEVSFTATAVNRGEEGQITDFEGSNYLPASETAIARAKKAFDENPVAAVQAQLSPGSGAPRLMYKDISGKMYSNSEAEAMIEKRAVDKKKGIFNALELAK